MLSVNWANNANAILEAQISVGGGQPAATSAVVSEKFTIEGEQKLPE